MDDGATKAKGTVEAAKTTGAAGAVGAPETAGAVCPLPGSFKPATGRQTLAVLARMGPAYWMKAAGIAVVAALLIGVPTVLIPNPIFVREVDATAADYVIFAVSALLMGVTWALPDPAAVAESAAKSMPAAGPGAERRSLIGAFGAFFAVGCPTCNKIVLLLLGSSGALTYFAPLQPLLGVVAVAFIVAALRRRAGQLVGAGESSAA